MPLTITLRRAAAAFGVQGPAAGRRLKGLPVTKMPPTGRGGRQHVYPLAAVLPRVHRPEHIGPMFRASTDDSSLFVGTGAEVMQMAEELDAWLTPAMRSRYARVRAQILAGLAAGRGGAAFLPLIETLYRKVLLHSDVLRHVVLG